MRLGLRGNQPLCTRSCCSNISSIDQKLEKPVTPSNAEAKTLSTSNAATISATPATANHHQQRVPKPDDEECRHTYHYSHPINLRNQFCHIIFCFIRQSYHKASTLPNACGKALKKGAGNISRRLAYFIVLLMLHKRITSSKAFPWELPILGCRQELSFR